MLRNRVKIVTDASCDLPKALVDKYNIIVIPIPVFLGKEVYRIFDETKKITTKEFYKKLEKINEFPSTSQPSSGDFMNTYKQILESKTKANTIFSIHLSSKMSGLVHHAERISQMFGKREIKVIDSLTVGTAMGNIIIEAAEMVSRGAARYQIVKRLKKMKRKSNFVLVLDTLEYLFKGGRIGLANSLMNSPLDEKPVIRIEKGEVVPAGVVEESNIKERLEKLVDHHIDSLLVPRILVCYTSGRKQLASAILDYIRSSDSDIDCHLIQSSAAINTHLGPKAIGLSWIGKYQESWIK